MARTRNFRILMSEDERQMVLDLAAKDGLTMADLVRQLVRREHRSKFPDKHVTVRKAPRK